MFGNRKRIHDNSVTLTCQQPGTDLPLSVYVNMRRYLRRILRIIWNILTLSDIGRQYPDRAFEILWRSLPPDMLVLGPIRSYGRFVHRRRSKHQERIGSEYTRFFRNPSQLEVLRHIVIQKETGPALRLCVLGCSNGAEIYSALWTIRSARPDLHVIPFGLDISASAIETARKGLYLFGSKELEGLSDETIALAFDKGDGFLKILEWIREGVSWMVEDARNPGLLDILGPQDIVFANNFLCHMPESEAEDCVRNIFKLVVPGGYLFLWGVDLDIKTKAVKEIGLIPVTFRLEEVYKADKRALEVWPLKYWGLEPLDKSLPDWETRYATVFQVPLRSFQC